MNKYLKSFLFIITIVLILGVSINIYNSISSTKVEEKKVLSNTMKTNKKNDSNTNNKKSEENKDNDLYELKSKESSKENNSYHEVKTNDDTELDNKESDKNKTNTTTTSGTESDNNTNNDNKSTNSEEKNKITEHTATFYINDKLIAEKCSSEDKSCTIISPEINIDGYETIGWSTSQNSRNADYKTNTEISISEDKKFYSVTRKKIDVKFEDNSNKTEDKSCYIYNDEKSCSIISPSGNVDENTEIVGWSKTKHSTNVDWNINTEKQVSSNENYYIVTRNKKYLKANFIVQDEKNVKASSKEEICYLYNGAKSCKIKVPSLKSTSQTTALGWSVDENSETAPVKENTELVLTTSRTYYSITSTKINITFDKNTTYNNNTVKKDEEGYSYTKENIGAEKLSFYETSCISYNGKGCKIKNVPIIFSTGNEIRGFSLEPDRTTINVYNKEFKEDTTLYARVYNNKNRGTFNTISYGFLGNVPIEIDKNISANSRNAYMNYIKQLYEDMPELFYTNGKLTLLSQSVYADAVKGSSAGITGGHVPNVLINIPTDVVLDKNREATIVHELGHAFGDQYGRKTGNYPEQNPALINIYNTYKNYTTKPMREYSYAHINEFFADMFRFAYEERFHRGTDIGKKENGYTNKTTTEINNILNRYLCVARNGYNENEQSCK